MAARKAAGKATGITITAPNYRVLVTTLVGTNPYVSNNFSQEAAEKMQADQSAGEQAKTGRAKKPPKDFDAAFRGSLHPMSDGKGYGIPVMAFKSSLVRACAISGIEMTKAKMCIFVLADGESEAGVPLVRFTKGKPEKFIRPVRNSNGSMDLRSRGKFATGWECVLRVRYDADLFSDEHVANLINRAGISVGVGAGRPFSKESCGCEWGTFEIKDAKKRVA